MAPVELGRGSTGRVLAEYDESLRCHVAVKRLDPELAKEAFYRRSFVVEAEINGRLRHPNIVPFYRLATDEEGVPYLKLKLVEGISLVAWLADPEHSLASPDRATKGLGILLEVCDAVAYAHGQGVLHLDVKPANVMVGEGDRTYLLDWSLARFKVQDEASEPSREAADVEPSMPFGTPGYLAPEQARGNPAELTERSDVFGLGAVLCEVVTGKTPYGDHRNPELLLRQARLGAVAPVGRVVAGAPAGLPAIIRRATAPRPADRYASVLDFRQDVHACVRGR
jgi:serine/threonine protein kinase